MEERGGKGSRRVREEEGRKRGGKGGRREEDFWFGLVCFWLVLSLCFFSFLRLDGKIPARLYPDPILPDDVD